MALRFVLVSAVASLGLSLPEEGEVRTWAAVAQTWAYAGLAEWDAWCAGQGGAAVLASRPEESLASLPTREDPAFDAAMEETWRLFSTERPAAPAFEPLVVGEDLYTGTAYALNRASEGLAVFRRAIGEREAPAEYRAVVVAEESPSGGTNSSSRRESGPVQVFAEAARGRRAGDFEPMVVGDDLYVGWSYSLNRASEGLGVASDGSTLQATTVASRVPQLSVALRLTREAVYAWSKLLHGPAVVAISR